MLKYYPRLDEQLYKTVLPNGLTVMVCPRPGFTKNLAYFVTDFGAIHTKFTLDGVEYTAPDGVAHYLEHKLFDMPGRDVSAEFAALGANTNAFTSYDITAYYFSCTENFESCLRLLLEFVSTPYFTRETVEKEQGIIAQEIDMTADSPDTAVFEGLMDNMYRVHPVSIPILGFHHTIREITPEILHTCHRAFYRPGNMVLCVVGDVKPEDICRIASEVLPREDNAQVQLQRSWPEEMTVPQEKSQRTMEVAMPMFQLGFKAEPRERGEEAIREEILADLAAEALFGESSGLYLRLYDQGLIDSSFGGGFETIEGMAMLTCSGDSYEPEAVRDAILEEARRIVKEGIDQAQFDRMRRSALGRRTKGLDSFDSTCFRLCAYHLSGFDYFDFPRLYEDLEVSQLQAFLERVVTPQRCSICVIRPTENS
ncbi:MAG: insulinase family protein [Oscillospiraceae bacterium]|nr:insulinase family protein [Oscillospiraceae bacterium]